MLFCCVCFPGELSGGSACWDGIFPHCRKPAGSWRGVFFGSTFDTCSFGFIMSQPRERIIYCCILVVACFEIRLRYKRRTSMYFRVFFDKVLCFQENDELMEWWNTVKGLYVCVQLWLVQTCLFIQTYIHTHLHTQEISTLITNSVTTSAGCQVGQSGMRHPISRRMMRKCKHSLFS